MSRDVAVSVDARVESGTNAPNALYALFT